MESITAARKGTASAATVAVPDITSGGQANVQVQQETDGFHLLIDALRLNGIDTIFGLPGIPITDLTRKAQAAGLRVISFRHEQNAGYAASIAGFMTAEARHLPDRVGPRLSQWPHGTGERHHQLLPDDPDQRLERARGGRPFAG